MHVIEVGVGPGALTLALLRAIGPGGTLASYELREDFAARARDNVERFHGPAPNWRLHVADAFAGFTERDVDRVVIDLAEPWRLLDRVAEALRPGGVVTGFVPTALQVKEFVDALRAHGGFAGVETLETLTRFWHVRDRSLRPEHRMVAHTGFLVFARRLAPGHAFALTPSERSDSTDVEDTRAQDPGSTHDDQGGDPREGLDDD
jgi:tRNA (adenine57-N1/adenine58-N1)-methyltransferase